MKNAFIELWFELWDAIWRGVKLAVTIIIMLVIVFHVTMKKRTDDYRAKRDAKEAAAMIAEVAQ